MALSQCMFICICSCYAMFLFIHAFLALMCQRLWKMESLKINSNFVSDYNEEIHFAVGNVSQLKFKARHETYNHTQMKSRDGILFLYATSYKIIIKLTFEIQCLLACLNFDGFFTFIRLDASTDQFRSKHFTVFIQCY